MTHGPIMTYLFHQTQLSSEDMPLSTGASIHEYLTKSTAEAHVAVGAHSIAVANVEDMSIQ